MKARYKKQRKMSNISSRAPRIISFFAVSYIMFGSSNSFYYNVAYIFLLCLVWLHGFRTRYVQEENRRRLVRERLEFKRIFSSPSGKKIFAEQERVVQTEDTVIATALAIVEANEDSHSHSSLSTNDDDNSSLMSSNSSSSINPPICSVHTIEQTDLLCLAETGSIASQECCSICLETYAVDDSIARVKKFGSRRRCNHWFHEECILAWLQHHNECPLCRRDIINNDHKETLSAIAVNYGTLSRPQAVTVV